MKKCIKTLLATIAGCTLALGAESAFAQPSLDAIVTRGPGVHSARCALGTTCTPIRGRITIVGGTSGTGTIATVLYPSTAEVQVCQVTQNGGFVALGIGNSVPTKTGFNITAGIRIVGVTFDVNYSCQR